MEQTKLKYLKLLSGSYPNIATASSEIINLQAILNLPKGTEHFLTDIHGEYEAFSHILKNGSGTIRRKIHEIFESRLNEDEMRSLASLIYYPKEQIETLELHTDTKRIWYEDTLYQLIEVARHSSSKYTRSKVRKAMPEEFAYMMEELMMVRPDLVDKEKYYKAIIDSIIGTGRADAFIIALAELIQRLVIDHLHILGDIYDRGPSAHLIMDRLVDYHSVDIQWGNHDVLWMGAGAGQQACIANVIRICARYNNLDTLEDGYGINLLPLASYAMEMYEGDECEQFSIKGRKSDERESRIDKVIHKAISIIQFKIEGQIIEKYPEFDMGDRRLLDKINYHNGTITIDGEDYQLKDDNFPSIDPQNPYRLSEREQDIMNRLESAFTNCRKLQKHMKLFLSKGSLYKVLNGNIMYHGCVLMEDDGSIKEVELFGKKYKGIDWYDALEAYVRLAYTASDKEEKDLGKDMMWYLWCNKNSPLFGKEKMATFERYFLQGNDLHIEKKTPYYELLDNEEAMENIFKEFGVDSSTGHIINGHVPVKIKEGESPLKCGGKVLVIDGGLSKAYQKETGIAGYTLVYNSIGLILAAHEPFMSTNKAIATKSDIHSDNIVVERIEKRMLVGDTDKGKEIKETVKDLEDLLLAYRRGILKERY